MMTSSPASLLLLLFQLVDLLHGGRLLTRVKERARNLRLQEAKQYLLHQVKEGRLHQRLDHFSGRDLGTFPQRFFINEAFWRRPDGPVFLFIGGEGPLSELDVVAGHHADMARVHGALLLAVEHRFYGDSINPDGLRTETLVHLSSQQALADLATFHLHISRVFNLSAANAWISFGGSYSGALAAWFRGKFPHLVHGAVASSAPVQAQLDFSAYNHIVGLSLMNEAVGGSRECLAEVRRSFSAVEAALTGGNASQVAADFGCCQIPKSPDDQMELMQSLADIIIGTVQYNEEGVLMSIREMCDVLTNEGQPYSPLVKLTQIYRSTADETCLDVSHEETIRDLMSVSLHSSRRTERLWTYQTCSEFGFYQTCKDPSCPFSGMLTLQSWTALCPLLFGISRHSLPERVSFTNAFYGGSRPQTGGVIYVNGGVDPWHQLSVLPGGGSGARTVFTKDSAHCADMMSGRITDRASLRKARQTPRYLNSTWDRTSSPTRSGHSTRFQLSTTVSDFEVPIVIRLFEPFRRELEIMTR